MGIAGEIEGDMARRVRRRMPLFEFTADAEREPCLERGSNGEQGLFLRSPLRGNRRRRTWTERGLQESGVKQCWITRMKYKDKGIWARYLGAIYWSVACLKGTDNDWAVTLGEKMVAVIVMICGGGVYTFMIGEVGAGSRRARA